MAFAAALCTAVFASCQKINESDLAASAGDIITKTLPVSRELWTSEATKSTYEEGVGLYLTGDEHISVFYSPYVEGAEGQKLSIFSRTMSRPSLPATEKYTFSHDAIEGAESYNYYFLMPYTQRASANTARTGMSARLSPVQCPGENDIDPSNDWLIGRIQTDVAKSEELQVTEFKRLFAPFKLVVADPDNIFGDEKLRTATLTFSQEATNKSNSIVGVFYADFSDNYEDAGVSSFLSTALETRLLPCSERTDAARQPRAICLVHAQSDRHSGRRCDSDCLVRHQDHHEKRQPVFACHHRGRQVQQTHIQHVRLGHAS